ncbi:MAG TPA: S41 family peptidase, partial [Gemmatimonadales bacterium]|nr:S41 family peptidase [Gemmatimonadales bacterium]
MKMRFVPRRAVALPATVVAAALAASCSGGDSSGPPAPYAQYAQRCANPPAGDQQGTLTDEKNWLRTWIDDTYLWYREVPTLDPTQYATAIDYFAALKTPLLNPSGTPKDKFHFTMSTADWLAFVNSGNAVSYGVDFFAVNRSAPNRDLRVAFVANGGPGAIAGFRRGTQITNVDGANVADGDANVINAGLAPTSTNPTHSFQYVLPGSTTTQSVNLTAVSLTEDPVPVRQVFPGPNGTSFGYLLFNDQIKTAENELISAINFFKGPPKITELVLDLRYNGGGLLYIASQLAYMISGPSTAGATFEALTFNDKHQTIDPAGNPVGPTPFYNITTQ